MLRLSLIVCLSALVSFSTGLPSYGWRWRVALEQKLDGCPCKVQLGGLATKASHIASEIIPRSEYNAWVKAGRPDRFSKMLSNASPASFGNVTEPTLLKPFCFKSEKSVPGDYNVLLYSSGDDISKPEIKDIARRACPANADIEDYGNNGDRDECDNEGNGNENGMEVSNKLYQGKVSDSLGQATRIIHGALVQEKELAAYNVKITHLDPHEHIEVESCSGSLIAPQYVLTAAHCKVKVNEHVFIGDYIGQKGEEHIVVEAIPHPGYAELSPTHDNRIGTEINDIQLLRLQAPVLNAESRMVAVNTDCNRPVPCRKALVSGYGESAEKKCGEDVLRYTLVDIVGHDACHKLLTDANEVLAEHCLDESPHICATHDLCGSGLCHGDSGGPLVVSDKDNKEVVQVGISSYIVGECGARDHPDIYTRVSAYKWWIYKNTQGTAKFDPPITTQMDCPRRQIWHRCNEADGIRLSGSGGTVIEGEEHGTGTGEGNLAPPP